VKEGDVVLASLPQADGVSKNRPAVILREVPPYGDLLVCGISAHARRFAPNFDEWITHADSDFLQSGLASESVIRLGFIGTLPRTSVLGGIGQIALERHKRLLTRLAEHLLGQRNNSEP